MQQNWQQTSFSPRNKKTTVFQVLHNCCKACLATWINTLIKASSVVKRFFKASKPLITKWLLNRNSKYGVSAFSQLNTYYPYSTLLNRVNCVLSHCDRWKLWRINDLPFQSYLTPICKEIWIMLLLSYVNLKPMWRQPRFGSTSIISGRLVRSSQPTNPCLPLGEGLFFLQKKGCLLR